MDSKSDVCMANNGNNTKHTSHNARRVHFVKNGKKFKMHRMEWCEGGLQLADIVTKNVEESHLNPRIRYSMVSLYNW